jgi:hypothetical protein
MNKSYNKESILSSAKLREQVWTKASNKRFEMKCSVSWCENQITVFNFKLQSKILNDYSVDNLAPVCNRCHEYINKHGYKKWNTNIEKKTAPNRETPKPQMREIQIQTESTVLEPFGSERGSERGSEKGSEIKAPTYENPIKVKKIDNSFVPKMPIIPNYLESKNYNKKREGFFDKLISKIF